jgi:carbon-monoxide dehydrogenase small subunit
MKNKFILNGEDAEKSADANQNLLAVLQKQSHLLTKVRHCQTGTCGRCMISLENNLVLSCLIPFYRVKGKEIITPEGFSLTEDYKKLWDWLSRSGIEEEQEAVNVLLFALHTLLDTGSSPDSPEIKQVLEDFPTLGAPKDSLLKAVRLLHNRKEVRRSERR